MTSKPADPTAVEDPQRALEQQAIERLDAGEPAASAEEAAARAPYERLIGRLRAVEDEQEPPAGWEDRAVGRWRSAQRRRWRNVAAGAVVAIGAAAVLLLRCAGGGSGSGSGGDDGEGIVVAVLDGSGQARRGATEATVGQLLQVRAASGTVRLLVYRGARRVISCPDDEGCRRERDELVLVWRPAEAGEHQIVRIFGGTPHGLSERGLIDLDLLAARQAGARIEERKVRVVR